jgi:hypothetical protein
MSHHGLHDPQLDAWSVHLQRGYPFSKDVDLICRLERLRPLSPRRHVKYYLEPLFSAGLDWTVAHLLEEPSRK